MNRATAIAGAVLIFVVVFLAIGFVVTRAFEDQNLKMLVGEVLAAILAFLAARSSYRATMRIAKIR